MKMITLENQTYNLSQLALKLGISPALLRYRIHRHGFETALKMTPPRHQTVTHQGKSQSVARWSKESRVHPTTIWWRLKQGWDIDRVFSKPHSEKSNVVGVNV